VRIQHSFKDQELIVLPRLHSGQRKAYQALSSHRFGALRCGRRFGKTEFAKAWIADGILKSEQCGWFAPQYKLMAEVIEEMDRMLAPLLTSRSRSKGVMRFTTGARLDFWSLENPIAGRSRGYDRVVVDEAAFAKDDDGAVGPMVEIWEKAIKPTLHDRSGRALVCSNSAGKDPANFFYNICTDPKFGFHEYHATTLDNPLLPMRIKGESEERWVRRRTEELDKLKRDNAPLVYAQEYLAEFVDWSGVAFFCRGKLQVDGNPVSYPTHCDLVFAVVDTAVKTGSEHDGTGVVYCARDMQGPVSRLWILDWNIEQIEGGSLADWLPSVAQRLEDLARACHARMGSAGAFIEDKGSGSVLLQQAHGRGLVAHAIDSRLTAMGKDERALNISGYVHQERVKYTDYAFDKTVVYKRRSANHLIDQVESFRMGDKNSRREDDLLDCFCYAVAISLGNDEGF